MRILLTIEYDGTDYCGWQIQPNGKTVEEEIETALFRLTGEKISVTGSGRTDSGVHAAGQTAHFDTQSKIPSERFSYALNSLLPKDIRIVSSVEVPQTFHARFSAKKKTYRYSMYVSNTEKPLKERYAAEIYPLPDIEKMKKICGLLIGEHDFKCFSSSGSEVKSTIRTVYSAEITSNGEDIAFIVSGNGFLYNMVRIMAGTLLSAGYGKLSEADILTALTSGDRTKAGKTMEAKGLCLMKVEYKGYNY